MEPNPVRDLNMAVTAAIFRAERENTVAAWTEVRDLEQRLSVEAGTELERDIGARGVVMAQEKIDKLRRIRP
jgi:hypothetical protein